MNLLEIGKIVRPHGVKGAVKVLGYIDDLTSLKSVFVGKNLVKMNVLKISPLTNDAYILTLDTIKTVEQAETYRNSLVYIDRQEYEQFKNKIYISDLVGKPVINEKHEKLGEMVDFDDYGASVILTIKCGAVSYQIPYVDDIIEYNPDLNSFVVDEQKFKDLRV